MLTCKWNLLFLHSLNKLEKFTVAHARKKKQMKFCKNKKSKILIYLMGLIIPKNDFFKTYKIIAGRLWIVRVRIQILLNFWHKITRIVMLVVAGSNKNWLNESFRMTSVLTTFQSLYLWSDTQPAIFG